MLAENDTQAAGLSILTRMDTPPDQAAEHHKLARRYGTAPEVVAHDPAAFRERAAVDDAMPILGVSPRLSAWMGNRPQVAEIVHDDLDNMGVIESTIGALGKFARNPLLSIAGGIDSVLRDQSPSTLSKVAAAASKAPAKILPNLGAGALDIAAGTVGAVAPPVNWATRALGLGEPALDLSNRLTQTANALASPEAEPLVQAALSGVRSIPVSVMSAVVTLLTKSPAAGAGVAAGVTGGLSYAEGRRQGLSDGAAVAYGGIDAVLEGGTEYLGERFLGQDIAARSGLARTLANQLKAEIPTEQLAKITQDFNQWAFIGANQGKTFGDYLRERPNAAIETAIATLVGVGATTTAVSGVAKAYRTATGADAKAAEAASVHETITTLRDIAKASKVLARDSETFRQAIDAMAEGTNAETLFVSPDALDSLAQSGVDIDALLPTAAADLAEARATGRDVALPAAEFVTAAAGNDKLDTLLDHVKIDPAGFTKAEADSYMQSDRAAALNAEIERNVAAQNRSEDEDADRNTVRDQVLAQLSANGRWTRPVLDIQASYVANFYAVLGQRLGKSAADTFAQYPLTFAAQPVTGGGYVGQSAVGDVGGSNGRSDTQTDGGNDPRGTVGVDATGDRRADAGGGLQVQAGGGDARSDSGFGGGGRGDFQPREPLFLRTGRSPGETGGLLARHTPAPGDTADGRAAPTFTFDELDASDPAQAQRFADAITAGKDSLGDEGAQVYVYPAEGYQAMRLFLTPDGLVGFAIKSDGDIVSVFRHPDGPRRAVPNIMALAKQEGGTKLDCFDIATGGAPPLRALYEREGFAVTERMAWDDQYAPENWPERFGKPDVVYMALDANAGSAAQPTAGDSYAQAYQTETPPIVSSPVSEDMLATFKSAAARMLLVNNDQTLTGFEWGKRLGQVAMGLPNAVGVFGKIGGPTFFMEAYPAVLFPAGKVQALIGDMIFAAGGAKLFGKNSQSDYMTVDEARSTDDSARTANPVGAVPPGEGGSAAPSAPNGSSAAAAETGGAADGGQSAAVPGEASGVVSGDALPASAAAGVGDVAVGQFVPGAAQSELFPADTKLGGAPFDVGAIASIDVDGATRPVRNSDGEPIAQSKAALEAFWRWFGDSAAVDRSGRPITFYHGTRAENDFSTIDLGVQGSGMFFAIDQATARGFANGNAFGDGIAKVYLRVDNPLYYDARGNMWDNLTGYYDSGALDEARDEYVANAMARFDPSAAVAEKTITDANGERTVWVIETKGDIHDGEYASEAAAEAMVDSVGEVERDQYEETVRDEANDLDESDFGIEASGTTTDSVVNDARGDGYSSVWFTEVDEGSGATEVIVIISQPDSVKNIANRGTFETGNANMFEQNNRGAFTPATMTVTELASADLSTFLHETAHAFLEIYIKVASAPGAPPAIVADMQAFFKWSGVKNLAAWNEKSLDQRRDAHEKWARGFEKRLMSGRSPSLRLDRLFSTFRAWLVSVYKQMKALNVSVSPDVRGVMDRMLATDAEIAEAQAARSMLPMFATQAASGMDANAWRNYQAQAAMAADDAASELETRSIRDMQWLTGARSRALKDFQRQARNVRSAARKAIEAEVMARPVYRAMEFLKRGTIDGAPVEGGFKLAIAEVDAMLGDAPGAKAVKDKLGYGKYGMLGTENGVHPQQVAELFGFRDADRLVRELVAAPDPKTEIDGLTEQRLLEEHGDLTDPVSIGRAADKAVHNEARGRFVASELAALEKATGKKKLLGQAARSFAERAIARLRIRDLKPSRYTAAETRAAKASLEALAKGNLAAAAAEKRNQLVNFYTARAAMNAAAEVEKAVAYFRKFDREGVRKSIDPDYRDQIEQLLERFDLRVSVSQKALAKRKSLAAWVERQRDLGFEPIVPDNLLDDAAKTHFTEMTVEDMRGLVDTIKNIEHLGRLKNRLLTAKRERDFRKAVDMAEASILRNATGAARTAIESNQWIDKARGNVASFFAMHRKFASLMRTMDGFEHGPLWDLLVRGMNAAGDSETQMRADATRALTKILAPIWKAGGLRKKLFIPEIGASLSLEGRLAIALNAGNETNRLRVLEGDRWNAAQVDAIHESLTAEQWQTVQRVWDYIDSYWPQIAAKERRVSGVEPERVERAPFTVRTADGQTLNLPGGYYPIKYDPNRSTKAEADEAAEVTRSAMQGLYTRATTRRGHTKARVESVKRPVRKDLGVVFQHITEVTHDLAWHEWLIDATRLLRAGPIDSAIRDSYGPQTLKALRDAVNDMATGEVGAQNMFETAVNHLRTGVTISGLGWNFMTSLLQPLGLSNSIRMVGPKWVGVGVARVFKDAASLNASTTWIKQRSTFMAGRVDTQQREISEIRNKVAKEQNRALTAVQDSFFYLISRGQIIADVPTWVGAYEKAMASPSNLDANGNPDEARAVALADQAVLDSQGGGQIKDLAAIQRGGPLPKLFTTFYSYMNLTYNQLAEETGELRLKGAKQLPYFLMDVALISFIPTTLVFLMRQAISGGDDDDDETLALKLAKENLGFFLGTMVGLRELGSILTSDYRYTGPAGLRFFDSVAKLNNQIKQGEADEALWKAANQVGGALLHYPAVQVERTARGIRALADGDTQNPLVLLTGPKKAA